MNLLSGDILDDALIVGVDAEDLMTGVLLMEDLCEGDFTERCSGEKLVDEVNALVFGVDLTRDDLSGFGVDLTRDDLSGFGVDLTRDDLSGIVEDLTRDDLSGFVEDLIRDDLSGGITDDLSEFGIRYLS